MMDAFSILDITMQAATNRLRARQYYAADVINGVMRWSGADIRGNWTSSYAEQRKHASAALRVAGGCTVALRRSGLNVTGVYVGQDDYGNAVYQTCAGPQTALTLRYAR